MNECEVLVSCENEPWVKGTDLCVSSLMIRITYNRGKVRKVQGKAY